MSLNWEWTDKMGELTREFNGKEYKESIYKGNAYFIIVHEDGDQYSLIDFACDKEHFKNNLGLNAKKGFSGIYRGCGYKKVRLNTRYSNVHEIISLIAKAKLPITIELYNDD